MLYLTIKYMFLTSLVCLIISIELSFFLKLIKRFKKIIFHSKNSKTIIFSKKLNDFEKEKLLPKESIDLLISSVSALVTILLIFSPFFIASYLNKSFFEYIISLRGLIEVFLISSLYLLTRSKILE